MRKLPAYYVLCALYDGKWSVQFGDYEKDVVKDERADWADGEPETQTTILKCEDSQASIDAAVAMANGEKVGVA